MRNHGSHGIVTHVARHEVNHAVRRYARHAGPPVSLKVGVFLSLIVAGIIFVMQSGHDTAPAPTTPAPVETVSHTVTPVFGCWVEQSQEVICGDTHLRPVGSTDIPASDPAAGLVHPVAHESAPTHHKAHKAAHASHKASNGQCYEDGTCEHAGHKHLTHAQVQQAIAQAKSMN